MAKQLFSRPLYEDDLIELFPQLLEALGIEEPDGAMRYWVVDAQHLDPAYEGKLIKAMGFYPWISLEQAQASGKKNDMRIAQMQHTMAEVMRTYGFVFGESKLNDDDVMTKRLEITRQFMMYIARQPEPRNFKKHLAALSGVKRDDIETKYAFEHKNLETQLANLILLARLAEAAIRKIMPNGEPYLGTAPDATESAILTRALLAAEDVWCTNRGDPDVLVAYREANIIGALTHMKTDGYLQFELGFFDEVRVEAIRQRIAYAVLTGRRQLDEEPDLERYADAPPAGRTRKMLRNAAKLLNGWVDERFDGDLSQFSSMLGVFQRFTENKASAAERATLMMPHMQQRCEDMMALNLLVQLVDSYHSLCLDEADAQETHTPRIMRRAYDHIETLYDAMRDETAPELPVMAGKHAAQASSAGAAPIKPDRTKTRLHRFRPGRHVKPN